MKNLFKFFINIVKQFFIMLTPFAEDMSLFAKQPGFYSPFFVIAFSILVYVWWMVL